MGKSLRDTYGQWVYQFHAETGANTPSYTQFLTNLNENERQMLLIDVVEWYITAAYRELILGQPDSITLALTMWNFGLGRQPYFYDSGVLDWHQLQNVNYIAVGAATGLGSVPEDMVSSTFYGNRPGGGIICHPSSLWMCAHGTSIANAVSATCRVHYTLVALKDSDYMELFQQQIVRNIIGA